MKKEYICVCGKIIPLELKQRKTCSDVCRSLNLSYQLKGKTGGYRHFSGHNKENKGYYKGIYCDSTWELAYVIYNLDHNISFKRCTKVYEYEYNGEIHKYHPDFELEDGTLIEIKGYEYNDSLKYKIESVKDRDIQILRYGDLEDIFKYVIDTYGKDFKKLYDK